MEISGRSGILVNPYKRLNNKMIEIIHRASLDLLQNPGVEVRNEEAVEIFRKGGAEAGRQQNGAWRVKIPERTVMHALDAAPGEVCLGARNPENAMVLKGTEPGVFFGTGSEANFILEVRKEELALREDPSRGLVLPGYTKRRGTVRDLCDAARLGEQLAHLDFFIRPVNIQDEDITEENKDVNKFFACLDNTTKHVMAGLTDLNQLDNVVRMAEIAAGGEEELRRNPVISFITCVTKSPLQFVDDATRKMLAVIEKGLPVVLSSSPQGGSSAPIDEVGIVAQINAEILSVVTLSQLARPGAPVIYGSVPVRARMDNLHDMYGAPEFNQYNVDCVQMARYYELPVYSTGGVADAKVPGIQATVEKLFSHLFVTMSGPHLLHYAFGLLEETQTFCPVQAVMDNEHIGMVKSVMEPPEITGEAAAKSLETIRSVMNSSHRLFARYTRRLIHSGRLYMGYPFEGDGEYDDAVIRAIDKTEQLLAGPAPRLPETARKRIFEEVPGILDRLK
ncbi:MAG: trimethylamine methyltransferase family protein [Bacillota bacterium]